MDRVQLQCLAHGHGLRRRRRPIASLHCYHVLFFDVVHAMLWLLRRAALPPLNSLCRSRQELSSAPHVPFLSFLNLLFEQIANSNAYLVAKIGVDAAKNELGKMRIGKMI